MLEHVGSYLREVEERKDINNPSSAYQALRGLGLNDFGSVLWSLPLKDYPKISSLLPSMTSQEIQRQWTGFTGDKLLDQSVSFVRSAAENFTALTGNTLRSKRILDYGCGYGRFLRLFRFYSDHVWGVDAWDESLALSRSFGFASHVKKVDAAPTSLPFDEDFHFVFSFSVFTHLNAETATSVLGAIRNKVMPGGILCITVRPIEFWDGRFHNVRGGQEDLRSKLKKLHLETGFAFSPSGHREHDPEGAFGLATMSIDWLQSAARGWNIVATDRSLNDPMQRYVFLRAI